MKEVKAENVGDKDYKSFGGHETKSGMKIPKKEEDLFFDPHQKGKLVCICGYELILEDEDRYRCTGTNHVYFIKDSQVEYDANGNVLMKFPKPKKEGDKKK